MQYFFKFYESTSTDLPQRMVALDEQVGDMVVGGAAAIRGARKQWLPQDRLPLQAAPCSRQCVSEVRSNRCTEDTCCGLPPSQTAAPLRIRHSMNALKWRRGGSLVLLLRS